MALDLLQRDFPDETEVEILAKPIVSKIAALEGRPALEGEPIAKIGLADKGKEPRETIVALKYILPEALSTIRG
jgi:hypothetical protein